MIDRFDGVSVPLGGVGAAKLRRLNTPRTRAMEKSAQVTTPRKTNIPDREVGFLSINKGLGVN